MRLVVKQGDKVVSEFHFAKGPVRVGRGADCQVFLPDRAVSRRHAMLFTTADGNWMVEDLDSANKTYLNDRAIQKAALKGGDHLRIGDYAIEVDLESPADQTGPIHLDDTLATIPVRPQVIVRKPYEDHAPDIVLSAKRVKDYLRATEAICKANGIEGVLRTLLDVTMSQFEASRVWGALRNEPSGPMICHAGRSRDGQAIELNDIELRDRVTQAVEEGVFLLLPRAGQVSGGSGDVQGPIGSVMIAPLVDLTGCFGVLYIDNSVKSRAFELSDLDYLMLLAIHSAVVVENF
jgi:pSer/pThr/pTyr-binding forkhead associated (FHA) protein